MAGRPLRLAPAVLVLLGFVCALVMVDTVFFTALTPLLPAPPCSARPSSCLVRASPLRRGYGRHGPPCATGRSAPACGS